MLSICCIKYNILRVTVILYLSLADIINSPLSITRYPLQHKFDISIAKTTYEKGTQSRPGLTVDSNNKGELYPIAFVNKN